MDHRSWMPATDIYSKSLIFFENPEDVFPTKKSSFCFLMVGWSSTISELLSYLVSPGFTNWNSQFYAFSPCLVLEFPMAAKVYLFFLLYPQHRSMIAWRWSPGPPGSSFPFFRRIDTAQICFLTESKFWIFISSFFLFIIFPVYFPTNSAVSSKLTLLNTWYTPRHTRWKEYGLFSTPWMPVVSIRETTAIYRFANGNSSSAESNS